MSRSLFTYLFISFCLCGWSQVQNNNLVLVSENGSRFILYVNGEKVNNEPQANVKALNVNEGYCKLKVEFEKDKTILSDSIHIKAFDKNNNKEITYSIQQHNGKTGKFHFVSIGELSGPVTPKVPEAPIDKGPVIDNTIYGNLYKATDNKPVFFRNYNDSMKTCTVELNGTDIKHGLNLINKSNDIHNKYKYTETIIEQNCYTVEQIIPLLALLEVELDKLKLSKRAYPHLKDKNNAIKLEEIYKFNGIKEDYHLFLKEMLNAEHQKGMVCAVAVNNDIFQEMVSAIKKGPYENDRIKIAKEKLVNNCVNTQQVQTLMELFAYDREKMELVKNAYAVTVDKDNYKILVENFQFSENKTEFLQFIQK